MFLLFFAAIALFVYMYSRLDELDSRVQLLEFETTSKEYEEEFTTENKEYEDKDEKEY